MIISTHPYYPRDRSFFKGAKPPPVPPPIPPVTESSVLKKTMELEQRQLAAKRKGMQATLMAGETGGVADEKKTLLGS
jgi:hypothetical protein